MLTVKEFYQGYQADYYAYRQLRLKKELDDLSNKKSEPTQMDIYDYSVDDHARSIKIDIRQTYFQAIETVFELIFSFRPIGGTIRDDLVLANLIKKKDHYEDIRNFAAGSGGLNFLEEIVEFEGGVSLPAVQYIFYGLLTNDQLKGRIDESLLAIRKILKILAADISDRKEYNAYKHGLRIFPVSSYFSLHDHKTMEEIIKWDLRDSMSYIEHDEKTGRIDIVTKLFDPMRDHNLTIMCNNLISNMIMIRRSSYNEKGKMICIMPFDRQEVDQQSKSNVKLQDLKFSSTPIRMNQQI